MERKYDVEKFLSLVQKNMQEGEEITEFPSRFFQAYFSGEREFYQSSQSEIKKFDIIWIKTIESYFPSLNRITVNLKSSLKYQSEIIPIEKTKKINKESVIHLMSHSNLIREVTEDEEVIPKQILTTLSEVEYGIYENRFTMTLIKRLRDFIGKRIQVMKDSLKGTNVVRLNIKSAFNIDGSDVEMQVDMKSSQPTKRDKIVEHNEYVLAKAENLFRLITKLDNSQFMRIMKRYRPVNPPIMKTSIILKNPDFRNAYLLWLFLDKCNDLGYELSVTTVKNRFSEEYIRDINKSLLVFYSAMLKNDKNATDITLDGKVVYKELKAKQIQRLPDEIDIFKPSAIELDNNSLNEYYLNKSRQIFAREYQSFVTESEGDEKMALKKALWETTKITDAIYESYFEINADEDIYQRLVKEDDPEKMLDEAYRKYSISKTVREVKEADFLKAVRLEKKWQRQLKKHQDLIIKKLKKKSMEEYEAAIAKDKKTYDKRLKKTDAFVAQTKQLLQFKHEKELSDYKKKLAEDFRNEKEKIIAVNKKKIAAAKEKQRIRAEEIKQRKMEQLKKQRIRLLEKRKAEKEKEREKLKRQKERILALEKKKLEKARQEKTNIVKQKTVTATAQKKNATNSKKTPATPGKSVNK